MKGKESACHNPREVSYTAFASVTNIRSGAFPLFSSVMTPFSFSFRPPMNRLLTYPAKYASSVVFSEKSILPCTSIFLFLVILTLPKPVAARTHNHMKGNMLMKAHTIPCLAFSRIGPRMAGGSEEIPCPIGDEPPVALMENPALLKKTEVMIVIAKVPPNGIANVFIAMTEDMLFGKKPIPWRVPGINRRPVPAPVSPIMKAMVTW